MNLARNRYASCSALKPHIKQTKKKNHLRHAMWCEFFSSRLSNRVEQTNRHTRNHKRGKTSSSIPIHENDTGINSFPYVLFFQLNRSSHKKAQKNNNNNKACCHFFILYGYYSVVSLSLSLRTFFYSYLLLWYTHAVV